DHRRFRQHWRRLVLLAADRRHTEEEEHEPRTIQRVFHGRSAHHRSSPESSQTGDRTPDDSEPVLFAWACWGGAVVERLVTHQEPPGVVRACVTGVKAVAYPGLAKRSVAALGSS